MYRAVKVSLESLPLLVAALRDSEVQIVYLDEDLPDSVDDNDNSDNDDDYDGAGIDEDNNDDDEASEYVNTSRLCGRLQVACSYSLYLRILSSPNQTQRARGVVCCGVCACCVWLVLAGVCS